jgi:flagellar protein FliO/FliZ
MDVFFYIKFLLGFVFVISLMLFCGWLVKKAGVGGTLLQKRDKRLKIVEVLPIDHKHRLVMIRRDNREHLLLIGPESEAVIESGIVASDDDSHEAVTFARDQRNVKI